MSPYANIIQKSVKLIVCILFPAVFWGQKQLTGLWTGALSNDSTTTRKEQTFEIALTEYRGKVYGYSRSEFIVGDTLYYILKRVKGTIDGDICEVKDEEIISYNFRGKLDKGVKMTSIFRMNKQDSVWHLDGTWKTNKTKNFYSISGGITLKEEKDLSQSKIFPHLEELKLADDVAFYKEENPVNFPAIKNQRDNSKTEDLSKVVVKKQKPADLPDKNIVNSSNDLKKRISSQTEQPVEPAKPAQRNKENPVAVNKPELKKANPVQSGELTTANSPVVINNGPAALVNERSSVFSPTVFIKSDSLELSLYDNGEIDGDTVSVLLNGNLIIAKECLKASAIKRTVYITPDMGDSVVIVLYAENLGKYPPNTGLLVIHDGDNAYQVRFSADLQTNAAIILRRKK
ncbi:MAG: hypothetical protein IT214_08470 [Chitinophagaceae bacterium]|nr:hypothetical protein [Chitinophagaceae bacterium]OQY92393.1 MAG: hypothetical protein B6D37_13955 [Sphingobacteriales bacterium UTBCD1]